MERAVLREAKAGLIEKLHLLDGKYLKRARCCCSTPIPNDS